MVSFPFRKQCKFNIAGAGVICRLFVFCTEIAFVILGVIQKYGRKNFQKGEA